MTGKNTLIPIPAGNTGTTNQPDFGRAAIELYEAGWIPMPLRPKSKTPTVKFERWKQNISARTLRRYWQKHPDHELAVLLGPDTLVVDADTPEGVIGLYMLEKSFDITPNLIVETDRGEHHYFLLAPGTFAKCDAPDKGEHPDRVDIKTGNAITAVPPSTGKQYALNEATSATDLVEVHQAFVDAVFRHNGRSAPRPPSDSVEAPRTAPRDEGPLTVEIRRLLAHIDPDSGYDTWRTVAMAIHFEFRGNDTGFDLFDAWSSRGNKYPGRQELMKKWRSFDGGADNPIKLGTLYRLAGESGADLSEQFEEFFEPIVGAEATLPAHGLVPYSLRGLSRQFEAEMLEHRFVLPGIAILGQWTVIYAPPGSGKTLITLRMTIDGIIAGEIHPEDLFYVNADDNHAGLTAKLKLAEMHGFHMLAPGYQKFRVKDFLKLLRDLCTSKRARGTILVLDTLKKFTDLMSKSVSADFGGAIREYVAKGGTLIGLAHVNKKRNSDGKPVYAGTTDIIDDADCAFVLDIIGDEGDVRTVEFENIKSRGMVVKRVAYSYSTSEGQSYSALLDSVTQVDDTTAEGLRAAAAALDEQDIPLIQAAEACIRDGITAKTLLIAEVVDRTKCSRRTAERVIDKYAGPDPTKHHWNFTRGARGLTTYELLPAPDDVEDILDLDPLDATDAVTGPLDLDDGEIY